MYSIKVDEDIFAILQKHARPLLDSPNSTLRRLLGVDPPLSLANTSPTASAAASADDDLEKLLHDVTARTRSKAPKADLKELSAAGLLHEGQTLFLVDYQGKRAQNCQATISGNYLRYNGQLHSMSSLAEARLKAAGFRSNSVRGPAHWVTDQDVSIRTLWDQLLEKRVNA